MNESNQEFKKKNNNIKKNKKSSKNRLPVSKRIPKELKKLTEKREEQLNMKIFFINYEKLLNKPQIFCIKLIQK